MDNLPLSFSRVLEPGETVEGLVGRKPWNVEYAIKYLEDGAALPEPSRVSIKPEFVSTTEEGGAVVAERAFAVGRGGTAISAAQAYGRAIVDGHGFAVTVGTHGIAIGFGGDVVVGDRSIAILIGDGRIRIGKGSVAVIIANDRNCRLKVRVFRAGWKLKANKFYKFDWCELVEF